MKKVLLVFCSALMIQIFMTLNCIAQTDSCIVKLKNANTSYEQGEYDAAIRVLISALDGCSLDNMEKIQANKLLILSYLKVDNLEEADKTAARIMKIDPYFQPDKFRDDPKLSALFIKYTPTPVFRLGFSGGLNFSNVKEVNSFSIVHEDAAPGIDKYNNKTGFQLGLSGEYRAYKKLWIVLGFGFRQSKYEHLLYDVENTTINYEEKLSYFDIPLSFKYSILEKTFSPYIQAGVDFSFLSSALSTTSRDNESDLVDRFSYRNNYQTGYICSAGATYGMKGIQLFADISYHYYPENVNKEGTRYSDLVNVFKYYYIDDDFTMNNIQINVGISYAFTYKNLIK